jgi:hypothetical protein
MLNPAASPLNLPHLDNKSAQQIDRKKASKPLFALAAMMALSNFLAMIRSTAGSTCKQAFRARCVLLIYTAFTNLICNKEITYGRDK